MKKIFFAAFTVALTLVGCFKDDYDFNNVAVDNFNPEFATPLVNAKLSLFDLVQSTLENDSSVLTMNDDSLLFITYSSKLFQLGLNDFFSVENQSISERIQMDAFNINDTTVFTGVTMEQVTDNFDATQRNIIQSADNSTTVFPPIPAQSGGEFNALAFDDFEFVTLESGALEVEITNQWPIALNNLQIEFRNGDNSIVGVAVYNSIAPNSSAVQTMNLAGKTMNKDLVIAITNLESPGSAPDMVAINLDDSLKIQVATKSLNIESGSAIFPNGSVASESIAVDMALGNGETINELSLSSGLINYDIDFGIRENAALTITLPFAVKNSVAFSEVININSNNIDVTTVSGSFDLTGYTLDLTGGGAFTNRVQADIAASIISSGNPIPFAQTDAVDAELTLTNLGISSLKGDIGVQTFSLESDTVDFGFDELDFDADITLADPRINIEITNAFGLQLGADLGSLIAENDERSLALTGLDSITIAAPNVLGDSVKTSVLIDANSTNINDILAIKPSRLIFGMSGSTNPGTGPFNNFVSSESYVGVTMDVDVPLYGSVEGFILKDTIDFSADLLDNLLSAKFRTVITNEFPVDINVQAYFVDDNFTVLDSLSTTPINVLSSSSVDGNGELIAASEKTETIDLSQEKLLALRNATQLILVSSLNTAAGQNAKFYANYEMNISLGVFAKVKIELE